MECTTRHGNLIKIWQNKIWYVTISGTNDNQHNNHNKFLSNNISIEHAKINIKRHHAV